jgi:hypothetical protein
MSIEVQPVEPLHPPRRRLRWDLVTVVTWIAAALVLAVVRNTRPDVVPAGVITEGTIVIGGWLALMMMGAAMASLTGAPRRRRMRAIRALRCPQCGYDLRGSLHSLRCPECGTPFEVYARTQT